MSIGLTDELEVKTKKGKIASAKQVFLEGDQENLQQIGDKTHQLEDAIKDITVSGGASTANAVSYNNETSGMTAVTAQGAIDELATKSKSQESEIAKKANSEDVTSQMQTEQYRVNAELAKKFNSENIAQEAGKSEDKVMSQKSVSTKLSDMSLKFNDKVDTSNKEETDMSDTSDSFLIADKDGNVALKVDKNGAHTDTIKSKYQNSDDDSFLVADKDGNVALKVDKNGAHTDTIKSKYQNSDDDSFLVADKDGNVALKVDKNGVKGKGILTLNDIPSNINRENFVSKNYFPADINLLITYGQSNSLNGNYPIPVYNFENALAFKGEEASGRLFFSNGVIDDKEPDELDVTFGGGFVKLQNYTESIFTIGAGIYEYLKTIKEENNITDFEELGFQLLGVTCGQVKNIKDLSNRDGIYYKRILNCVTYAKKYANALGKSFSVPYLTYIEGENDLLSDEKYFHDMLWVFFSNIEHDIKVITEQENDIVFMTYQPGKLVGPLNSETRYSGSSVGLVKLSVEKGDGNGYELDETALSYKQENVALIERDKIHFSCPFYFLASELGYQEGVTATPIHLSWSKGIFNIFGAYQGLQAKRCLTDGTPLPTLYPKSHNIIDCGDGTYNITVEFIVPVEPLQFKKYDATLGNFASQTIQKDGYEPNYGFQLVEKQYSNDFKNIIKSVRIKRRKFIEIKTSSNPKGMYLVYAHKGWLSGGNLCDSQGLKNKIEVGNYTFPLDNWCPVFDYLLN